MVSLTQSRKIPTRKLLPLFFATKVGRKPLKLVSGTKAEGFNEGTTAHAAITVDEYAITKRAAIFSRRLFFLIR